MTTTAETAMTPLRERPAWAQLASHHATIADRHLRDLFAEDPDRGTRPTAEGAGLYLDYSKNRVTDETLRLLVALAERHGRRVGRRRHRIGLLVRRRARPSARRCGP